MTSEANKKAFRDSLASGIDKYVKQQGRNTFELNCRTASACEGYVRVPGPHACDFCVTMGASDNFYHTQESAGGGVGHGSKDDLYHPYCNCTVAAVFRRRGELVARDPETGDDMPYDGASIVQRYREAGSPTFRKNRQAEAERRRIRRRNGEVPATRGKRNAYAGARLSDADFDAAMKSLAEARSVDELHVVAERIVAEWPKNANGRNKAQWGELSKFAKTQKMELERKSASMPREGKYSDAFEHWRRLGYETERLPTVANEHYGEIVKDELLGLSKGSPMKFKNADGGNVNPDFAMGGGYKTNCQSSVVAYVARRKGWNVQAIPAMPGSVCEELSKDISMVWRYSDGAYVTRSDYVVIDRCESVSEALRKLEQSGNHNRIYTLDFDWKGYGGHTCILERDHTGQLFVYDAQSSDVFHGKQLAGFLSMIDLKKPLYLLDVTELELDRWVAENILRAAV